MGIVVFLFHFYLFTRRLRSTDAGDSLPVALDTVDGDGAGDDFMAVDGVINVADDGGEDSVICYTRKKHTT